MWEYIILLGVETTSLLTLKVNNNLNIYDKLVCNLVDRELFNEGHSWDELFICIFAVMI